MANNFVELKGSVFKKFDARNLFQIACADVVERFRFGGPALEFDIGTFVRFNGIGVI